MTLSKLYTVVDALLDGVFVCFTHNVAAAAAPAVLL
jgi:hypothetical protein